MIIALIGKSAFVCHRQHLPIEPDVRPLQIVEFRDSCSGAGQPDNRVLKPAKIWRPLAKFKHGFHLVGRVAVSPFAIRFLHRQLDEICGKMPLFNQPLDRCLQQRDLAENRFAAIAFLFEMFRVCDQYSRLHTSPIFDLHVSGEHFKLVQNRSIPGPSGCTYSRRPRLIIRRTFDMDAGTVATKSFKGRNRRGCSDWQSIVFLKARSSDTAMKYESPTMIEGKGARTFSLCVFDRLGCQFWLLPLTQYYAESVGQLWNLFPNCFNVFTKKIRERLIEMYLLTSDFVGVAILNDPPIMLEAKLPCKGRKSRRLFG